MAKEKEVKMVVWNRPSGTTIPLAYTPNLKKFALGHGWKTDAMVKAEGKTAA